MKILLATCLMFALTSFSNPITERRRSTHKAKGVVWMCERDKGHADLHRARISKRTVIMWDTRKKK